MMSLLDISKHEVFCVGVQWKQDQTRKLMQYLMCHTRELNFYLDGFV